VLIVAAAHGQAPIDHTLVRDVATSVVPAVVEAVKPGLLAQFTGDDVGLLWLTDQTRTADVKAALLANAAAAGVGTVLAGADLGALYPEPATDPRTPDLIIETQPGVIYSDSVKLAEHAASATTTRRSRCSSPTPAARPWSRTPSIHAGSPPPSSAP